MEIKIIHACGTKFVFDAEPENGAMPFAIQCPGCNEDATADANAVIAQALATSPPPAVSTPPPPPPPPPAPKPGLVLGRSHAPDAHSETTPPPPPPETSTPAATTIKPAKKSGINLASDEPSLPLAITGAAIGAAIGMGTWYAMIHYLHFSTGWVAWGTGALAGFGARALGRSPTPLFGVIAAVFTLLAIVGGSYLAISSDIETAIRQQSEIRYQALHAFAKAVSTAKDDDELRGILADPKYRAVRIETGDEGFTKFKSELPKLKEIAGGKPSKEEMKKQMAEKMRDQISIAQVAKSYFRIFTIIFILLGLSTAFKIGSGMGS